MQKINIAIDGLSSTGKSSLARALAQELSYTYIDSGAMYRAITLYFITHDIDVALASHDLEKVLDKITLSFINQRMILNGIDVEDDIRTMRISALVSEVAALPQVRDFCVVQQQKYGLHKAVVMDGRDIGTVVFPNAELKIFLCAQEDVRVQRRYDELKARGKNVILDEVRKNLLHRDHIDSTRTYNPLVKASDAKELDNSHLSIAQQIDQIKEWINALS